MMRPVIFALLLLQCACSSRRDHYDRDTAKDVDASDEHDIWDKETSMVPGAVRNWTATTPIGQKFLSLWQTRTGEPLPLTIGSTPHDPERRTVPEFNPYSQGSKIPVLQLGSAAFMWVIPVVTQLRLPSARVASAQLQAYVVAWAELDPVAAADQSVVVKFQNMILHQVSADEETRVLLPLKSTKVPYPLVPISFAASRNPSSLCNTPVRLGALVFLPESRAWAETSIEGVMECPQVR